MRYAEKTTVSDERTRGEIEMLVRRHGATEFMTGWSKSGRAIVGFRCSDRLVRFEMPRPREDDERFSFGARRVGGRRVSASERTEQKIQEEMRRRWRALLLVIKAKLEAVETEITTFEQEFLAHIVLPGGQTVGEQVTKHIAESYESGKARPLLGA